MALVVESGAGSSTAESYISVTDADTYFSVRGDTVWTALTTAQKESNLRKATEYMLQMFRMRWKGVRMLSTQALDWPRAYVYLEPVITGANQEYPNLVADDIVPTEVKRACAELAVRASAATLLADLTQAKTHVKVGPIETTYDPYSAQAKRYQAIEAMLAPYMERGAGAVVGVRA